MVALMTKAIAALVLMLLTTQVAAADDIPALIDPSGALPAGITVAGEVDQVVRWQDKQGAHVAVFTRSVTPPRADGTSVATVTVVLFAKVKGSYRRGRSWVARSGRCARSGAAVDTTQVAVSDRDNDGIGELTFGLVVDCPRRYTFTLVEGNKAWQSRYDGQLADECSPIYRYQQSGSDFARAPAPFRIVAAELNP